MKSSTLAFLAFSAVMRRSWAAVVPGDVRQNEEVESGNEEQGYAGVLVSKGGRVLSLTAFTIVDGRVVAMDILADGERLVGRIAYFT